MARTEGTRAIDADIAGGICSCNIYNRLCCGFISTDVDNVCWGVILTTLIKIPNWPFFNKHPLKWLDPSEAEKHPKPQVAVTSASKKKPNKKLAIAIIS